MLRPITPVINYAFNIDYYIEFLCENKSTPELNCNGKCHLKKELKQAHEPSQEEPSSSTTRIEFENYPLSLIEDSIFNLSSIDIMEYEDILGYHFKIKEFNPTLDSPPPQIA